MNKQRVIRQARDMVAAAHPDVDLRASCLYVSGAIVRVLARYNVRATVQAGSAGWRRIPPTEDDGKEPNAFSYICSRPSIVTRRPRQPSTNGTRNTPEFRRAGPLGKSTTNG